MSFNFQEVALVISFANFTTAFEDLKTAGGHADHTTVTYGEMDTLMEKFVMVNGGNGAKLTPYFRSAGADNEAVQWVDPHHSNSSEFADNVDYNVGPAGFTVVDEATALCRYIRDFFSQGGITWIETASGVEVDVPLDVNGIGTYIGDPNVAVPDRWMFTVITKAPASFFSSPSPVNSTYNTVIKADIYNRTSDAVMDHEVAQLVEAGVSSDRQQTFLAGVESIVG